MDTPNSNSWLLDHASIRNSQYGEDGIIEKIIEVMGDSIGWCVEFGAWDGRHLSNTFDLIANRGFGAVLIEASDERFEVLSKNYADNPKVHPVCAFVGFTADDGLDSILAKTSIPLEFDFLSIDIDGNDYHVWDAVTVYRPRCVVIEYNPTIPSSIEFVQPPDMKINQGSSALSLKKLGQKKDYELVSMTDGNCIFVRSELFELFGINDNSIEAMRPNENEVTYLFSGFDGTVFLRGSRKLPWIGFPILEKDVQVVPRWLRQFPSNYGPIKKFVSRPYRSLKKRRS
jgi:hypothetical protein